MSLKEKLDPNRIPRHIAIIMDGNGRWAKQRGKLRVFGHENGVKAVRATIEAASKLGVQYLTLYAFSTENWQRPKYEVDALMHLLIRSLHRELANLHENNIRLHAIGDLDSLPKEAAKGMQDAIRKTAQNTGLNLVLALSYSARWELAQAIKNIAAAISKGELEPGNIDEHTVAAHLTTRQIPDPDLLIRTSGEMRISNFLLWQIAYTELFFTPTLWPDFNEETLCEAIYEYQHRERRFGMTSEQIGSENHTEL
ncbi:MAG TPA: isoprenyl transferase [Bacteroidales bacterium]|nr:isoprenyl transferase [Bacteroidales bacterium]HRZ48498.1 isoprenyl transferase [Bacteroidales bacterium]